MDIAARKTSLILLLASLAAPGTAWGATSLIADQECTEKNSYLEPYLARGGHETCASCGSDHQPGSPSAVTHLNEDTNKAVGSQARPLSDQQAIPKECFLESMKARPHGRNYHYATCETDHSRAKDRPALPAPCITDSLVSPVRDALKQTMNCLGIKQQEVFSLFGMESHYQVNLHNSGGIGIGQLTTIAVADTDLGNHFQEDVSKPECQQFSSIFEESKANRSAIIANHGHYKATNPCQWLAQPENPARNLLYAGAVYREAKLRAQRIARSAAKTPSDAQQITIELARYMYSAAGPGGTSVLFHAWHVLNPGKMSAVAFKKSFRAFMKENNTDGLYSSTYTATVERQGREANKAVGASCAE